MATPSQGDRQSLCIAIQPDIVKKLDELRGNIPRSQIFRRALDEYLERHVVEKKVVGAIYEIK